MGYTGKEIVRGRAGTGASAGGVTFFPSISFCRSEPPLTDPLPYFFAAFFSPFGFTIGTDTGFVQIRSVEEAVFQSSGLSKAQRGTLARVACSRTVNTGGGSQSLLVGGVCAQRRVNVDGDTFLRFPLTLLVEGGIYFPRPNTSPEQKKKKMTPLSGLTPPMNRPVA